MNVVPISDYSLKSVCITSALEQFPALVFNFSIIGILFMLNHENAYSSYNIETIHPFHNLEN